MMKTFIVGPSDGALGDPDDVSLMRVVMASNEQEALEKYWADYEPDESDIEYCCTMNVCDSLVAEFCRDEHGDIYNPWDGELRKDIRDRFQDDQIGLNDYIRRNVESRVMEFFGNHLDYAKAYMAAHDQALLDPFCEIRFPKDMLMYMIRKTNAPDVIVREVKVLK